MTWAWQSATKNPIPGRCPGVTIKDTSVHTNACYRGEEAIGPRSIGVPILQKNHVSDARAEAWWRRHSRGGHFRRLWNLLTLELWSDSLVPP